MENNKKIMKLAVTTASHLAAMAIFFALAFFLAWLWPASKPYAIFAAAVVSFFFGAMWDANNFGVNMRNFYTFIVEIAMLTTVFVLSAIDHIFSLEIIPGIWRSLSLWPSLIAAVLSFLWFCYFLHYFTEYQKEKQAFGDESQEYYYNPRDYDYHIGDED